jgi:hypothetical protein
MIEASGDLFSYPADATCITTNGTVKKNGECVMGRGVALEAKKRWPAVPLVLGNAVNAFGNIVQSIYVIDYWSLVAFPVKHNWWEKADLDLIARSCGQLVDLADDCWECVALPRPGCGNGSLDWQEVKPVLGKLLDDRFVIVHR